MIIGINDETLNRIKNPTFRSYASIYVEIYKDFMAQIGKSGIKIDPQNNEVETCRKHERLRTKGATFRNNGKSIYVNNISPSCVACQTGIGSVTFFISLQCHRDCFYCFNPNQEDYEYFTQNKRDLVAELDQIHTNGYRVEHLALTGGEPLLHKDETVEFFRHSHEKFPTAYTRLYTCGDHVDEELLAELQKVNLDEIRFSIRPHDLEKDQWHTLDRIALAKEYIPYVMVEMPVFPGTLEMMKHLLLELDRLEIFSINLLEFCYPYSNTEIFNQRSYTTKRLPYNVLYNYWYAGGLPVSRSELDCLDLLEFVIDEKLSIGAHYCSLENKHTGQIYQQNQNQALSKTCYFSKKDYFIKSAKVFGEDIPIVVDAFKKIKRARFFINKEHDFLEFHVRKIKFLHDLDVEIGISSNVMEPREDGTYLRELKVDLTYAQVFDFQADI